MASKPSPATVQALQAKELVLQTEVNKYRELQKGRSCPPYYQLAMYVLTYHVDEFGASCILYRDSEMHSQPHAAGGAAE